MMKERGEKAAEVKITHKEVSMGSDGLFDRVKTQ
jgi:hypothetical protein